MDGRFRRRVRSKIDWAWIVPWMMDATPSARVRSMRCVHPSIAIKCDYQMHKDGPTGQHDALGLHASADKM